MGKLKEIIKKLLGIKSPSKEAVRQWEKWQTMTTEEREKIIEQEKQFQRDTLGEEIEYNFWWED
jgi:hypothetical protein